MRSATVFNTGSLHVVVTVSGEGADPDGIDVVIDGVTRGSVPGTGGTVAVGGLGVGVHSVFPGALSYNCAPDGSETLEVRAEQSVTASLLVTCVPALSQAVAFGAPPRQGLPNDIFRVNGDGTGLLNLTETPVDDDFYPAWSPDGTKIAFVSDRDDPWWDIYVMNADGSNVTRLTSDPGWDHAPVWSPDGTRIAFASDSRLRAQGDPEHLEVWVMNADEAARRASRRPPKRPRICRAVGRQTAVTSWWSVTIPGPPGIRSCTSRVPTGAASRS